MGAHSIDFKNPMSRSDDPLADRRTLLPGTMLLDRVLEVEQLSSDLRDDLFPVFQCECSVVPELVTKCARKVRQIELVIPVFRLKGRYKTVFGITDDFCVVSDRFCSVQGICNLAPRSVTETSSTDRDAASMSSASVTRAFWYSRSLY